MLLDVEELVLELKMTRCWETGDASPGRVDLKSIVGTVHFIGIGGIGMSALARLLLAQGIAVSGSDKEKNSITSQLEEMGAKIFIGHQASNVANAGMIVVSTAIVSGNPELAAASEKNLPVLHRSAMLDALTANQQVIAISGTHGKTTTTGMVAQLFLDSDQDPTVVVGGVFSKIGANSRFGKGKHFIAEADESDRTHANFQSHIAVVTNIEADHLENYPGGIAEIFDNMISFANQSKQCTVLCLDDAGCRAIMTDISGKVVTYGFADISPTADYTCENTGSQSMKVSKSGKVLGEVKLAVPGNHNKINALAAIAVAMEAGIPFDKAARSLAQFGGVARRFEIIGTKRGITVVDDYGHHPTEVKATLEAAQQYKRDNNMTGRVVAIFQPHQPGRLKDLWEEFCVAFDNADLLLLTDIYVARGGPIEGINSERFSKAIKGCPQIIYVSGKTADLPAQVIPHLMEGDLVLTIGAGDITRVGPDLVKQLA